MRNAKLELRKEELIDCFMDLDLSAEAEAKIKEYLMSDEPADESFDLGLKEDYTDLFDRANDIPRGKLAEQFKKLSEYSQKHPKDETGSKFFDIAFQIFGLSLFTSLRSLYPMVSNYPKKPAVELVCRAYHYSEGNYLRANYYKSVLEYLQNSRVTIEDVRLALRYVDCATFSLNYVMENGKKKVALMILSCLFYDKEEENAELGRISFVGPKPDEKIGETTVKRIVAAPKIKYPEEFGRLCGLLVECAGIPFRPVVNSHVFREYLVNPENFEKPVPQALIDILDYDVSQTYARDSNMQNFIYPLYALNYRKTPIAANFLRVMMALIPREVPTILKNADYREDMDAEFVRMFYDLTPDPVQFILWAGYDNRKELLKTLAVIQPKEYLEALNQISSTHYPMMMTIAKETPKEIFDKYYASVQTEQKDIVRKKMMDLLIFKGTAADGTDLEQLGCEVVLGKKPFSDIYPYKGEFIGTGDLFAEGLKSYMAVYGDDDFLKNIVVYSVLRSNMGNARWYCRTGNGYTDFDFERLFPVFDERSLPVSEQLAVVMEIYEYSWGNLKELQEEQICKHFSVQMTERGEEILQGFAKSNTEGRILAIRIIDESDYPEKKEALLSFVKDTSKQVKAVLIPALTKHPEWAEEYAKLLSSKKAGERELAANLLAGCGPDYTPALQAALDKEKNEAAANAMRAALGVGSDPAAKEGGALSTEELVKELHKGGKKKSIAWLFDNEPEMPVVHMAVKGAENTADNVETAKDAEITTDNKETAKEAENTADNTETSEVKAKENPAEASEDYLKAILLAYASLPTPGVSEQAKILAAEVDKNELARYMQEVYDRFMRGGAEAKKKWVLYAAAIHGGSAMVPVLKHQIDEWAASSRGAIAAEAIKALALNDSPTALLIVDNIARKYKFKQVRNAAKDALAFAASELGLTVEELSDRIVPDLGFNSVGERVFDYGTRSFTVRITPALEILIRNNDGKQVKSMPAPGKTDDEAVAAAAYAEFKEMKTQMKTVVKNQSARLELALSSVRLWSKENWEKLFVKNPIMHQFAISLIWGVYDENLKPVATFRYMEDGTFNTVEEDEYTIPEDAKIGLIHPVEISEEEKKTWKEQLEDYEIKQSVEQLSRPIYLITEEEKNAKVLSRFHGDEITDITLTNRMVNMGWEKGEALDAGIFVHFYREDKDAGLGVELAFSGAYIGGGYDYSETVTVEDARFYRIGITKPGYGYDHIKDEDALALSEIPARYFSEIVYQLTKATFVNSEE